MAFELCANQTHANVQHDTNSNLMQTQSTHLGSAHSHDARSNDPLYIECASQKLCPTISKEDATATTVDPQSLGKNIMDMHTSSASSVPSSSNSSRPGDNNVTEDSSHTQSASDDDPHNHSIHAKDLCSDTQSVSSDEMEVIFDDSDELCDQLFKTNRDDSQEESSLQAENDQDTSTSTTSRPQILQKRPRGRPRKIPPHTINIGTSFESSKKRAAEHVVPEALMGTKKIKTDTTLTSTLNRVPSSLTYEELQAFTSRDYLSYFVSIASTLSNAEKSIAKTQIRRIKNRESAQRSRAGKLEQYQSLNAQVKQLTRENEVLKSELKYYEKLIAQYMPSHLIHMYSSPDSSEQ